MEKEKTNRKGQDKIAVICGLVQDTGKIVVKR